MGRPGGGGRDEAEGSAARARVGATGEAEKGGLCERSRGAVGQGA